MSKRRRNKTASTKTAKGKSETAKSSEASSLVPSEESKTSPIFKEDRASLDGMLGGSMPESFFSDGIEVDEDDTKKRKVSVVNAAPPVSVVVVDYAGAHQKKLLDFLKAFGYRVETVPALEAVLHVKKQPADIVLVALPEQKAVLEGLADLRLRPVVLATAVGPALTARERCFLAGADGMLLRPYNRDGVASTMMTAVRLVDLRARIADMTKQNDRLTKSLRESGHIDEATGFRHFDFFKEVLVMELKRAKRFGYSLATCLVAFDRKSEQVPPDSVKLQLRQQVARAIASAIRDIDLPVVLDDERMLVFLPYTEIKGAEQVGKRIAKLVAQYGVARVGEEVFPVTVSVGIAALKQGKPISFAKLMHDAHTALRAAQLKGGGRVVVRV